MDTTAKGIRGANEERPKTDGISCPIKALEGKSEGEERKDHTHISDKGGNYTNFWFES